MLAVNYTLKLWGRMDSNHRKNTLTELQSVPFSHSGTPPVFFITTHSFCVLVKECAKVIVFFIMSKAVPKKNQKKRIKRRKGGKETGGKGEFTDFFPFLLFFFLLSCSKFIILSQNLIRLPWDLYRLGIDYSYRN